MTSSISIESALYNPCPVPLTFQAISESNSGYLPIYRVIAYMSISVDVEMIILPKAIKAQSRDSKGWIKIELNKLKVISKTPITDYSIATINGNGSNVQ